jgi:cell division transport system permease protein
MAWLGRVRRRIRAWGRRHSYSLFSSLGTLLQHRLGTMMTVAVLGIAILLPLGLFVTLQNLDRFDLPQEEWNAVSVFLPSATPATELQALASELESRPDVASVELVSPEQGMAEFEATSGFGQSLAVLDENPLPWVMVVQPAAPDGTTDPAALESGVQRLASFLESRPLVESVQFDSKWLQRLSRLLEFGRAVVLVLSLLFGVAVVVLVANTIRLDVAARAEEIEVLAMVGAGNAFIRQPFLYAGFWYGLMGGALALAMLHGALFYLSQPLQRLLDTYGQAFALASPTGSQGAVLLLASALLGWVGAWLSVQRYLRMLAVGGTLGRR